jgi:hypothetical protein
MVARGQKDFGNRIWEPVTAQMDGWVNVTRGKNQPRQIWTLKKRRDKAALIWPCRRVTMFPLHSYPLSPARAGLSFLHRASHHAREQYPSPARAPAESPCLLAAELSELAGHSHDDCGQRIPTTPRPSTAQPRHHRFEWYYYSLNVFPRDRSEDGEELAVPRPNAKGRNVRVTVEMRREADMPLASSKGRV